MPASSAARPASRIRSGRRRATASWIARRLTASSDLFRQSEVATVAGMAGTAANLGALLFSVAIGALVTTTGYTPFFMILGGIDLLGALILWLLVRPSDTVSEVKRDT